MICWPIKEGFQSYTLEELTVGRNGRPSLCDIYVYLFSRAEWLPIKFSDVVYFRRILHDPRRHLKSAGVVNDPCQPPKAVIRGEDDAFHAHPICLKDDLLAD
ncbi:hypothetical protein CEXT_393921 [Caerostris extrusa]|uniref:Uncharacterized protein n=1 Tax=Caerostris extrusa TaxID=172846 RepID=A0AAV4RJC8_CAEEX|nr:hypothetical protein CEXT_393921 [Caerostris extrusa]